MRAMILAAGRGERMRPLTDSCPKPLLPAGGQPLIVWHLRRLAQVGIRDVIINHAWLGARIEAALGDGSAWGVRLRYSPESPALETAAGIARALPFFCGEPFLVVNGDVWCDWNPAHALAWARHWPARQQAHLLLVDNPAHHPAGDFLLHPDGRLSADIPRPETATAAPRSEADADAATARNHATPTDAAPRGGLALTFAGIGLYRPALFEHVDAAQPAPLAPLLRAAMRQGAVGGTHHHGRWVDVGTPARLAALDAALRDQPPGC
ncbi:nucleotidyltransferase family protein [Castellaniella caeni]|uniref:nucleotidyltransferase family protein n=1 Tax=Castellaniella caeni TaxID=266123 RepID=UPI000C9EE2BF|nr:nucleotidyltransferase family protein [Castellaniella caeni]